MEMRVYSFNDEDGECELAKKHSNVGKVVGAAELNGPSTASYAEEAAVSLGVLKRQPTGSHQPGKDCNPFYVRQDSENNRSAPLNRSDSRSGDSSAFPPALGLSLAGEQWEGHVRSQDSSWGRRRPNSALQPFLQAIRAAQRNAQKKAQLHIASAIGTINISSQDPSAGTDKEEGDSKDVKAAEGNSGELRALEKPNTDAGQLQVDAVEQGIDSCTHCRCSVQ